jgi:tetratricopeptide (TPR) repeat protein
MVRVIETNLEQIKDKLDSIRTNFNKILYLESAIKKDFSIEIKRFIFMTLVVLYTQDGLYEKAAKTLSSKAKFDLTFKEKIESLISSAELYCKVGKIEDAEEMFSRSFREANEVQRLDILKKRKEMYFNYADYLEKQGKRSSSLKFYEKLMKIRLEKGERNKAKEKLIKTYTLLGRFKEANIISKME